MRYIIALLVGAACAFVLNVVFGYGEIGRPWGALIGGSTTGIVMVAVLILWEKTVPSEDHDVRDARLKEAEKARELRAKEREAARAEQNAPLVLETDEDKDPGQQ